MALHHPVRSLVISVLVLAFGAMGLPTTHAASDPPARLDPALRTQLEEADPGDGLLVFVHAERARAAVDAVRGTGLQLVDTFDAVGVAIGMGTPEQIRSLRSEEGVLYIEADRPIELLTDTSHVATRGEEALQGFTVEVESSPGEGDGNAKGIGQGSGNGNAPSGTETVEVPGVDGSGVTVAVVDSGIDGTHPMFERDDGTSKVVRNLKLACIQTTPVYFTVGVVPGTDRTPPSACPEDYEQTNSPETRDAQWIDLTAYGNDTDTPSLGGHGTHVAAIAGGTYVTTSDGRDLHGAAPGADLVGLSIGNALSIYGGTAGLNWVLDHHDAPCDGCSPIKVVNNSWGPSGGGEFDPDSVVSKIQDELVADGVTVVWANGNDGGDGTQNLSNPPAQTPTAGVLGVANYSDGDTGNRNNALASLSSRGQEGRPETYPDISAPGTAITSACRPYLAVCSTGGDTADTDYDTIGGTSMAAPHIAGIVAQLVEADPSITPGEIEDVLEDTAHEFVFGGPYEDDPRNPGSQTSFDKGHGLVDVVEAVSRVLGVTAPEASQPCDGGDTVVVDGAGDASAFIFDTPAPSEPSLDILEGRMSWDDTTEELTATIVVDDLTDGPPEGSLGRYNRYYFSHDGVEYYFVAARDPLGTEFRLVDTSQGATGETIVGDLDGALDADADEIRITLPAADFAAAKPDAAPIADGAVLSGFEILTQRYYVSLTPTADTAGAICPYVIGQGAVPPEPVEPEPEEADGQVSSDSPTYTWAGDPTTDSTFVFGCQGLSGRTCDVELVEVVVPEGGATSFDVSITADLSSANDYDLYVTEPDGTEHFDGVFGSDESISIPNPAPGTYKIRVEAFLTVEAGYEGTAELVL